MLLYKWLKVLYRDRKDISMISGNGSLSWLPIRSKYQGLGPTPDQVIQIFKDWLGFLEFLTIFSGVSEP